MGKKIESKTIEPKKNWFKRFRLKKKFQKCCDQKNWCKTFWEQKLFEPKKFGPEIFFVKQNSCPKKNSGFKKHLGPKDIWSCPQDIYMLLLPRQMTPWWSESILIVPRNLQLKFGQNWISTAELWLNLSFYGGVVCKVILMSNPT